MQYSLNEVVLLPSAELTDISSRSQVNPFTREGNLPIFVAPMTSIIDEKNYQKFIDNRVIPILPRNCLDTRNQNDIWHAYSLQEFENIINSPRDYNGYHILIDIANGHMKILYDYVIQAKKKWPGIIIMIGNIAHPYMYKECCDAGVNYVRIGIGSGSQCITSVQTGIHCSHLSMIQSIKYMQDHEGYNYTKTIADGGINTIDKAIKCLGLGYDYVMMGKCFAECKEACGLTKFDNNILYRRYYGMASKAGQQVLSGSILKNPEGIESWIPIITNLSDFTGQFEAALRSAMSYVGAHNLEEFKETQYDIQTIEEFKSYYK